MVQKISKAVGKGCKNEEADVKVVQELLNQFVKECGYAKFKVTGKYDSKIEAAIGTFEEMTSTGKTPKKKVEPGGPVMKSLTNPTPTRHVIAAMKAYKAAQEAAKKAKIAADIAEEYFKKGITEVALIPRGKPAVTGDTANVDKKIVTALNEISAHFAKPIKVTSGYRTATKQGEVMWKYWTENLDRGDIYDELNKNPDRKKTLNEYYDADNEKEFVKLAAKNAKSYSRHARGLAIDIAKSTDAKVVKALETVCRVLTENTCYHLDDRGTSFPSSITDDLRRKWKR